MTRLLPRFEHQRRILLATLTTILAAVAYALTTHAPPRAVAETVPTERLDLRPADHICIIGNTLADRMQHDGWLEALLQSRFPQHHLVVRNLGFSGDELTLRPRSDGFGSPDQHLSSHKADVVFAFFGYNESFAGPAGLENFKKELGEFIKHTLAQRYNDKSAPRLVLFSPIAHENLHDRNLPDGSANNKRLELYTAAMAQVARANRVPFVDLFKATQERYGQSAQRFTINGVHLNEHGNQLVAQLIDQALFGTEAPLKLDPQVVEKVRQAVIDKNDYWFNRYRTVDGFNIFGGRADLRYTDRISNRDVMQREMEVLDVMTANRDRRIWALAQGSDLKVDDSNTPPFIPVKTNMPGHGPNGEHVFLDGQAAIAKMKVASGMKINLFASEKDFPELAKPVQMAFDPQGRLWVAVWPTYPHWRPKEERNDKILILEDTDGDGKADKCTIFADHLHCPTGFEFYNGGVLVAQAPDVVFLKDTHGEGKADLRVRVLDGIDSADTHHTANSFTLDPGGALYFQEGTFHHTQVETPYGPPQRCANAGVFRYEPRTQKFEVYITYGFANPHGHVFDRWGQDIVIDGTGSNPYQAALFSGHLDYPNKHDHPPQVYQQRTRPAPGVEFLSSRHFPEANQGNLLVANVIGFQGILQYKITDRDSGFAGTEVEPIVSSTDPNFRPSDIKVGPDGAIYFLDWQNPIIGHMQHHLRDPNRDRTHGRIYRVTCESRPLLKPVAIAGQPIEQLLERLKEPEDRVRYRARIELGGRDSDQVMAALKKWMAGLDPNDPAHEHHLLEALWLHQAHNVVDEALLQRLLASPEYRARAAATRVLCYWRDRVPNALELLKKLAADPQGRVRLEAVRAASFFTVPEAVEIPLISAQYPGDPYLDFTRGETMKALDPYVKAAIAQGHDLPLTSPAGARFFLQRVRTEDLLKMKRTRGVYLELLFRPGVRDEYRHEALSGLAKLSRSSELQVLLEALHSQDQEQGSEDQSVVFDLVRLLTAQGGHDLSGARAAIEQLATSARRPVTRQIGFLALIAADGNVDRAWALAMHSVTALLDLVSAMPLIRDPNLRASLYPKIEPLLAGLPREFAASSGTGKEIRARYVRISLPGEHRTLTLAEVEVYSGGRNIARQGKATQKNTAHSGDASRAIDGNKNGHFGEGSQTHTVENTSNPWWEVDLGAEAPIDSIVICNRTDGDLGKRLDRFTLAVLDGHRNVVFRKDNLPAPDAQATFEVGGQTAEGAVRRAAMKALVSVRGQETRTFKALANLVRANVDRTDAIQSMQRIPVAYWPRDEVRPLLDSVLAQIRAVPVQDRASESVLDALQLADSLASLLAPAESRIVRHELGELGVRIIRLGTLTDQMLYDKERIVVKAGKPVEIIFENNDLMPHNLVIGQPGALEEIGTLAEATGTQPGALERQYVPPSNKVLWASRLLMPQDSQKMNFTAPAHPGVYPYLCTFPGHWRRMYGAMYVVADLDEYLAAPEEYLSKHPTPALDELLKSVRPRKEWTVSELAEPVAQLHHGRSFNNGKHMFQVANCIACHQVNGIGTPIGPDLTKLDPKLQPVDILRDIIEPSSRIDEKYQTFIFETEEGKVVTGLIVAETADIVKVIENPLVKSEPVVLKKSSILNRKKSATSLMPKGLLDKLSREEILDLVAYIAARGDAQHRLFQGTHDHAHVAAH